MFQNIRDLAHLHHKGGLSAREIVRRAHAGKHAVGHANMGGCRRHERADLRHDGDQRHLTHIGGFARHIRAGDDGDAVFAAVEDGVIRDEQAVRQHLFHDRMAAVPDLDAVGEVHHRAGVIVVTGHIRQRAQHVQHRDCLRGFLHAMNLGGNLVPHLGKDLVFQRRQPLLRAEHRAFERFELLCDIALAVCQRLLADIMLGDCVNIGLADLDIVAEYTVISDLELADTGLFALPLLNGSDLPLAARCQIAQGVDLRVVTGSDQAALAQQDRRIVNDRGLDQVVDVLQQIDVARDFSQQGLPEQRRLFADLRQAGDCGRQRAQIAAVCRTIDDAPDQPLHVEHLFECIGQCRAGDHIVAQRSHRLLAARDMQRVIQRPLQPLAEQARAHRRPGAVEHPEQRAFFLSRAHGLAQLEVAPGNHVQLHILPLMVDLQMIERPKARLLGLFQIIQQAAEALHGLRQIGQACGIKILDMEVLHHTFGCPLRVKALLRHRLDEGFQPLAQKAEKGFRGRCRATNQHLARLETAQLAGDILPTARAGGVDLARCDVREAHANASLHCINAAEEVVAVLIQHGGFHDRARRDTPHDLALDQALGLFGVLDLLADGDLVALAHELCNVSFRAVVRYATHGRALLLPAVAAGEGQFQLAGDQLGVLKEHLIKVAQTIKQDIILVLVFDLKILLHHGREFCHFCTSFYIFRANRQRSVVFSISASINSPMRISSPRTQTSRLPSVRAVNG